MPDRFGLRKATSIGPNREVEASDNWRYGMVTSPESYEGKLAEALKNNLILTGVRTLQQKGLKYVDDNVENPVYKIALKTVLNAPELLRLRNPASAIRKGSIGPIEKSEKMTEEMMSQYEPARKKIAEILDQKEFHDTFLQNMKKILEKQK